MLGDPTKLRNVPMTIRFTAKERATIEVLADLAGVEQKRLRPEIRESTYQIFKVVGGL